MPSIKRAASAPGGSAGCNLDEVPPAHADGARAKPFFAGSRFMTWHSLKSKLLLSSEVARLGATHWQVARVAGRTAAIGRQHGRNDMFENNLHAGARLQHDRKAIIDLDLTAEPDAIHEEHVYGGPFFYQRLQKFVLYAGVGDHVLRSKLLLF
jgi:hypothetical protein